MKDIPLLSDVVKTNLLNSRELPHFDDIPLMSEYLKGAGNNTTTPGTRLPNIVSNFDVTDFKFQPVYGDDNYLKRAQLQSHSEQVGKFLANLVPNMAIGLVRDLGYLGALFSEYGTDRDYSNPLIEFAEKARNLGGWGEVYREHPNKIWDPSDLAWWTNNLGQTIESVGTFALEGYGLGSLFGKLGVSLGRTLAGSRDLVKAIDAGNDIAHALKVSKLMESMNVLRTPSAIATSRLRIMGALQSIPVRAGHLANSFTLAYVEGAQIAHDVYKSVYNNAINDGLQPDVAKSLASRSASISAQMNTFFIGLTNLAVLAPISPMGLGYTKRSSLLKTIAGEDANATLTRLDNIIDNPTKNFSIFRPKSLKKLVAFESAQEFVEEAGINNWAEYSGNFYGNNVPKYRKHEDDNGMFYPDEEPQKDYMKGLVDRIISQQGLLEGLLGALGGAGQATILGNIKTEKEIDATGNIVRSETRIAKENRLRKDLVIRLRDNLKQDIDSINETKKQLQDTPEDGTVATKMKREAILQKLTFPTILQSVMNGTGDLLINTYKDLTAIDNTTTLDESALKPIKDLTDKKTELDNILQDHLKNNTLDEEQLTKLNDDISNNAKALEAATDYYDEVKGKTNAMHMGLAIDANDNSYVKKANSAIELISRLTKLQEHLEYAYNFDLDAQLSGYAKEIYNANLEVEHSKLHSEYYDDYIKTYKQEIKKALEEHGVDSETQTHYFDNLNIVAETHVLNTMLQEYDAIEDKRTSKAKALKKVIDSSKEQLDVKKTNAVDVVVIQHLYKKNLAEMLEKQIDINKHREVAEEQLLDLTKATTRKDMIDAWHKRGEQIEREHKTLMRARQLMKLADANITTEEQLDAVQIDETDKEVTDAKEKRREQIKKEQEVTQATATVETENKEAELNNEEIVDEVSGVNVEEIIPIETNIEEEIIQPKKNKKVRTKKTKPTIINTEPTITPTNNITISGLSTGLHDVLEDLKQFDKDLDKQLNEDNATVPSKEPTNLNKIIRYRKGWYGRKYRIYNRTVPYTRNPFLSKEMRQIAGRESTSLRAAILAFFIGGNKIRTADFIHETGYGAIDTDKSRGIDHLDPNAKPVRKQMTEFKEAFWMYKNDGVKLDKSFLNSLDLSEGLREQIANDPGGIQEAVQKVLISFTKKSEMIDAWYKETGIIFDEEQNRQLSEEESIEEQQRKYYESQGVLSDSEIQQEIDNASDTAVASTFIDEVRAITDDTFPIVLKIRDDILALVDERDFLLTTSFGATTLDAYKELLKSTNNDEIYTRESIDNFNTVFDKYEEDLNTLKKLLEDAYNPDFSINLEEAIPGGYYLARAAKIFAKFINVMSTTLNENSKFTLQDIIAYINSEDPTGKTASDNIRRILYAAKILNDSIEFRKDTHGIYNELYTRIDFANTKIDLKAIPTWYNIDNVISNEDFKSAMAIYTSIVNEYDKANYLPLVGFHNGEMQINDHQVELITNLLYNKDFGKEVIIKVDEEYIVDDEKYSYHTTKTDSNMVPVAIFDKATNLKIGQIVTLPYIVKNIIHMHGNYWFDVADTTSRIKENYDLLVELYRNGKFTEKVNDKWNKLFKAFKDQYNVSRGDNAVNSILNDDNKIKDAIIHIAKVSLYGLGFKVGTPTFNEDFVKENIKNWRDQINSQLFHAKQIRSKILTQPLTTTIKKIYGGNVMLSKNVNEGGIQTKRNLGEVIAVIKDGKPIENIDERIKELKLFVHKNGVFYDVEDTNNNRQTNPDKKTTGVIFVGVQNREKLVEMLVFNQQIKTHTDNKLYIDKIDELIRYLLDNFNKPNAVNAATVRLSKIISATYGGNLRFRFSNTNRYKGEIQPEFELFFKEDDISKSIKIIKTAVGDIKILLNTEETNGKIDLSKDNRKYQPLNKGYNYGTQDYINLLTRALNDQYRSVVLNKTGLISKGKYIDYITGITYNTYKEYLIKTNAIVTDIGAYMQNDVPISNVNAEGFVNLRATIDMTKVSSTQREVKQEVKKELKKEKNVIKQLFRKKVETTIKIEDISTKFEDITAFTKEEKDLIATLGGVAYNFVYITNENLNKVKQYVGENSLFPNKYGGFKESDVSGFIVPDIPHTVFIFTEKKGLVLHEVIHGKIRSLTPEQQLELKKVSIPIIDYINSQINDSTPDIIKAWMEQVNKNSSELYTYPFEYNEIAKWLVEQKYEKPNTETKSIFRELIETFFKFLNIDISGTLLDSITKTLEQFVTIKNDTFVNEIQSKLVQSQETNIIEKNTNSYTINGEEYQRVTNVIPTTFDKSENTTETMSTKVGTTIDTFIREVINNGMPNKEDLEIPITDDAYRDLITASVGLFNWANNNGYTLYANKTVLFHDENGNKVAGEFDIVGINEEKRTIVIIDTKTSQYSKFGRDSKFRTKISNPITNVVENTFDNHSNQVSLYKYMFEQQHGYKVEAIYEFPITVIFDETTLLNVMLDNKDGINDKAELIPLNYNTDIIDKVFQTDSNNEDDVPKLNFSYNLNILSVNDLIDQKLDTHELTAICGF